MPRELSSYLLQECQQGTMCGMLEDIDMKADQKKDEKHIVVPALGRTPSGVSMEYKCIIIANCMKI
jgi:hypothetical protein